jgi:exodeoxyribonuclease VII small subunit
MNPRIPVPTPDPPGGAEPSFEAAIKRLTEIVNSLERGELPLEDSLRLFEEGVKLSRISQRRLDAAERRVEQLLAVDDQGRTQTAPFATESAEPDDLDRDLAPGESEAHRPMAPR